MDGLVSRQIDIRAVQEAWHTLFEDEWVPSKEATEEMIEFAGDASTVIDAIEICSTTSKIFRKSFDVRLAYTRGIIKNIRGAKNRTRWES